MEELLDDLLRVVEKIDIVYTSFKESEEGLAENIQVLRQLKKIEDKIIDILAKEYDLWYVCQVLEDLEIDGNIKKRMHNRIILRLIKDEQDINYIESLNNLLLSDHLLISLAVNEENRSMGVNLNNVKYVIAFFAPMVEDELIGNNFQVNMHPFIASDTLMGLYNVPQSVHTNFKDARLIELFDNYFTFFSNHTFDNEGIITTGYIIQSFLRGVMALASPDLLNKMEERILKFINKKPESDIVYKILLGAINNDDKNIPYKVTLGL